MHKHCIVSHTEIPHDVCSSNRELHRFAIGSLMPCYFSVGVHYGRKLQHWEQGSI